MTQETKNKISISKKGSIPWNKGLKGWNKGHIVSPSTRRKIGLANSISLLGHIPWNKGKKGIHLSPKTEFQKGRVPSKEVRIKLSLAKKGKKPNNYGTKQSEEMKARRFAKISGENNYRWISDRTLLKDDSKERGGQLHREWSRSVKNRDSWKCKISNSDCGSRLESHHILNWKDYPELRYNINNGITLCHTHHPRKRVEELNLALYFKELIRT